MKAGTSSGTKGKRWLWIILAAVGLAAVVFLGGALSTPDSEAPAPSQLTPAARATKLTRDAEAALSRNETPTALSLAKQALAADPENTAARAVLERATAPVEPPKPVEQPAADGNAAPRDDSAYLDSVDELRTMLPKAITGWQAGQIVGNAPDVLVTFQPERGSDADALLERVVFSVHDLKSAEKAEQFVSGVSKTAYPDNGSTLAVGVIADAYFGTGRSGTAVIAFSRGRFAFETLLVAEQAIDPASLKATAQQLSAAFSATK